MPMNFPLLKLSFSLTMPHLVSSSLNALSTTDIIQTHPRYTSTMLNIITLVGTPEYAVEICTTPTFNDHDAITACSIICSDPKLHTFNILLEPAITMLHVDLRLLRLQLSLHRSY
jgi:hypothetical protein